MNSTTIYSDLYFPIECLELNHTIEITRDPWYYVL